MAVNVFKGARRIALLVAGIATIGTLAITLSSEPHLTAGYAVVDLGAPLVRREFDCPDEGRAVLFDANTRNGTSVWVTLCLLPSPFGNEQRMLIPYRKDPSGMLWGAETYSSELDAYSDQMERDFAFPVDEDARLSAERSRKYREEVWQALQYLGMFLLGFAAIVWILGWIVRGFLGIPLGADHGPKVS